MRRGEQRLDDLVEHEAAGLVVTLAFLVLHDAALVIELLLRDRAEQIAHAIAFQPQRAFERGAGHGLEIIGAVEIGRAVVIGRAHFLQVLEIVLRCVLAAVEHQMFEQVREAGLAFGFVLRSDIVPHRDGHDGSLAVGVDDDVEPVVERELLERDVDLVDQRGQFGGRGGIGCGHGGVGLCGGGNRGGRGAQREGEGAYGEEGLDLHGTSIGFLNLVNASRLTGQRRLVTVFRDAALARTSSRQK